MEKKNVPEIRFEGFTDDWEQYKMGDIASLITKGTTPLDKTDNGSVNFVKIENINISNGEIVPVTKISIQEHEGYLKRSQLQENDILFSIAGTLGRVSIVNKEILPANTNQALAIIRLKNGYLNYIATYLKGKTISNYIKKNPTIGAQPNLSLEQIVNLQIAYPNDDEQKRIGEYFKQFDYLITFHQRKYEKLKLFKEAMLDKMFPKNGQKVPEIRFKGFTDDWEEHKFSDITFLAGEKNKNNLRYESYSISNEKGFVPQNEQFENGGTMKDANKRMYYIVKPNSFAYNPARINIGSIGYSNLSKKVIVSSLYEVFQTVEDVDDRFLWHWFKTNTFQKMIEQLQEGGVRLYFYYDKLCMGTIMMPVLSEQKKIGEYLDNLDNLITLHQRKYEKLKLFKEAMLNKMFI